MGGITCCCCIPIRAGVITLAVLGLFWGGYNIFLGVAGFVNELEDNSTTVQTRNNETGINSDAVDHVSIAIALGAFGIINGLVGFIMSVVLLKGAIGRNVGHLKLWVKVGYILLVISALAIIALSVVRCVVLFPHDSDRVMILIVTLLIGVIALAISAYYIGVVKKYSGIVEEELNQGRVREKV